jgi:hypothetical protein
MPEATPCPFLSKPFFPEARIERICTEALEAEGLMPTEPEAIRIDRFIEKRFAITIGYDDLQCRFGKGVMGACGFDRDGRVSEILLEITLEEEGSKLAGKRVRSTAAHEGGHGLLHGALFAERYAAEEQMKQGIVKVDECAGVMHNGFACRNLGDAAPNGRRFDWWEVQANMAMAALLLPRKLVDPFVREIMSDPLPKHAWTGKRPDWQLKDVSGMVADKFDVSISMATYRIQDLHRRLLQEPTLL